jgi:hypothetical protein
LVFCCGRALVWLAASISFVFYISRSLSTNFWISVMLKHCVSNFRIFRNMCRKEGVNFLKSS